MRQIIIIGLVLIFTTMANAQDCDQQEGSPDNTTWGKFPIVREPHYTGLNPDGESPVVPYGCAFDWSYKANDPAIGSGTIFTYDGDPPPEDFWSTPSSGTQYYVKYRWTNDVNHETLGVLHYYTSDIYYYRDAEMWPPTGGLDPLTSDLDGDGVIDTEDCHAEDNNITGGEPTDTDGDGLADDVDPFPNDTSDFNFKKIGSYVDSDGNVTANIYSFLNENGQTVYKTLGDYDGDNDFLYLFPNEPWQDSSDYITTFGDGTVSDSETNPLTQVLPDGLVDPNTLGSEVTPSDLADGQDSTGNTTDTEHLGDIVDNTAKIANNQQDIVNALAQIESKIGQANEISYITGSNDSNGTSPTASEIGDAVGDALEGDGADPGDINGNSDALDTAYSGAENAFGTSNDIAVDAPEGYRERTDLEEKLNEVTSNPVVTQIQGIFGDSVLSASGSPCVDTTVYGKSISLCVDDYGGGLSAMGALMVSLVSLHALLIVFRRS